MDTSQPGCMQCNFCTVMCCTTGFIVYVSILPSRWQISTHTVQKYSILNINHLQEWNISMESYSIPLSIENPFRFHADNLVIQYISGLESEYNFSGALHLRIMLTRPTTDPLRFSYLLGERFMPLQPVSNFHQIYNSSPQKCLKAISAPTMTVESLAL